MKKVLAFCFLLLYNTSCRYDIRQTTLGFRQMVRHWILIPAFPGSNPGSAVREGTHYCVLFLYLGKILHTNSKKVHCYLIMSMLS